MSLVLASAAFLDGYRLGLTHEANDLDRLQTALHELGSHRTPFAFEGAAMAWRIRDDRDQTVRHLSTFFEATDTKWHPFLALGVGCALAKLGHPPPPDPVTLDGYGFQLGLLAGISGARIASAGPRIERGRGRALWFITGGEPAACAVTINNGSQVEERWRGVATACVFAGDPKDAATELWSLAVGFQDLLRQGAQDALALWQSLTESPPPRISAAFAALTKCNS